MARSFLSLALLATAALATPSTPLDGDVNDPCNACNPSGATGSTPPSVGTDQNKLYYELLDSVKDIHFKRRWVDRMVPRDDGFCCRESLDCVNVETINVPMCYDKFTTQYKFPDGSWGSLTTGDYTGSDGSTSNLISGNYTADGKTGNIYGDNASDKPNTSTLSIPPQFTGTGVGSAVPASELGSIILITSTIPGSVITTPTTLSSSVSGHMTAVATITGPTTMAAKTTVITSTVAAASSSASSTGAASQNGVDTSKSLVVSLFSALMYAFYAL